MQQAILMTFPRETVQYQLILRDERKFPEEFSNELTSWIASYSECIKLTPREKDFLSTNCSYFTPVYLDFLEGYRFNNKEVFCNQTDEGTLSISIVGEWYRTVLWEVPLMAMISELYFKMSKDNDIVIDSNEVSQLTRHKGSSLETRGIEYSDFGTRRRYSYNHHVQSLKDLKDVSPTCLIGTSNPYMARKFKIPCVGTVAHEWIMLHAAKYGFKMANKIAMENWIRVFQGELGIALSDTYTTDVFLRDFSTLFAKMFDGTRHDSGDPIEYLDKIIYHYKRLRIDPAIKVVLFSDSLNYDSIINISNAVKDSGEGIKAAFGIGTNLTNDIPGIRPLNMVIKMTKWYDETYGWVPTVKLSDTPGKHTGNDIQIANCKDELGLL